MKRSIGVVLGSSLVALALTVPAWAHHSFSAAYNMQNAITITGVITNVRLQNPHSWFFLDVKNEAGQVEKWAFEAGTPSGMIRNGYKPDLLKPGTEVTITGFHARDAKQNMGMLRELKTSDGRVFGMFGPQEGAGR
jgi:hypothetical protein